ncbi:SulP family inorganic anion transporter [Chelatococcus reniformis]|nr:SulP family inorganic anion transporter [Chelatococcus reniformis]
MPRLTGGARAGLDAGLSVAAQSLTHGMIVFAPLGAGMAPFGMAAALAASAAVGLMVALLGSSRPLIGTTSSSTALLAAAFLAASHVATPEAGVLLAMLLAFGAGLAMLALAFTGQARLAGMIPSPVTVGLMNSIVVLAVFSQLPVALGLAPGQKLAWALLHPASLIVAGLAVVLMLRPLPGLPPPMVALTSATLLHQALAAVGVELGPVVGASPSPAELLAGLESAWTAWDHLPDAGPLLGYLLPAALSLAALAALEGLTAGAALRENTGRRGDPGRDLMGTGAGMLACAVLGGVPAGASASASVASLRGGGQGRLAMLTRALVALLALLVAGPAIALLPYAALSGVLVGAVVHLLQWRSLVPASGPGLARRLADAGVALTVIGSTIWLGLVAAVGIGAVLSVVIFTASMAPAIRKHSRNPVGRSRVRRPAAVEAMLRAAGERIELIELEGAIFFGSADNIVVHAEAARAAGAEVMILDLSRVSRIDTSGGKRLLELCCAMPGRVVLCPLHETSRAHDELAALGLLARLPEGATFPSLAAAVEAAEEFVLKRAGVIQARECREARQMLEELGLPPTAMAATLPLMQEQRFAEGETIIRHGDAADAAYLLLEGQAIASLPATEGRQATRLAVLAPGVFFGEAALLRGTRRSADITARTALRCLRLPAAQMRALRARDPDAAWELMVCIAAQLASNVAAANATIDRLEG